MMIGVAIERHHVRAVAIRRGHVAWGMEAGIDPTAPLADVLTAFLATLPVRRWPFRLWPLQAVTVALGGVFAQTKRLAGLPPLTDERLVAHAVQEHIGRFFLKNGAPLVLTSMRITDPGTAWAAALDGNVVSGLETACRAARIRLLGVVPAADVLGRALALPKQGSAVWGEPGARSLVSWADGRLSTLARVSDAEPDPAFAPAVIPALTHLGADAWRFAAAYGAAVAGGSPLATLIWRASAANAIVPRRRLATAASAASLALIATLVAPGLAARYSERRATVHLEAVAAAQRVAQRTQREVGRVSAALGEIASFDTGVRPVVRMLAALARELPSGAALIAVRVDSGGGSIVALTPHAAQLLARIETTPGVVSPEIVSPVTREPIGGRELERVTVRFRWARQ